MPFLPPNQQRQSTEGTEVANKTAFKILEVSPAVLYLMIN